MFMDHCLIFRCLAYRKLFLALSVKHRYFFEFLYRLNIYVNTLQVLERVFQWIVLKDHLKNNNEHISSSESVKYGDQFIIWYSFPIHCSIFFKKFSNVSFLVSIMTAKTKRSIFYINQERPFCPSLFL